MRKARRMSETEGTVEITVKLPDRNERGFLRRIRETHAIMQESNVPGVMWLKLGEYALEHGYIQVEGADDPLAAIGELSQADMQRIASALMGMRVEDEPAAVDPPNDA